jgi:hypothetical protein
MPNPRSLPDVLFYPNVAHTPQLEPRSPDSPPIMYKSAFAPSATNLNRPYIRMLLSLLCSSLVAAEAPPAPTDPTPAPLIPPNAPPVPPPTKPGEQPPPGQITQISKTRYRLGKIEFDQVSRTITFSATLNMNKGMLEYALVNESGKLHEALLATKISPFNLNLVLIILKYKPAENFIPPELLSPDKQPTAGAKPSPIDPSNGFDIKVSWKDQEGIEKTARMEDWIHNAATKKKAEPGPFVYTGSDLDHNGIYSAQATGSIVALHSDPSAIFNNPRQENHSDGIWQAGPGAPPLQTKVQVTFCPCKKVVKEAGRK